MYSSELIYTFATVGSHICLTLCKVYLYHSRSGLGYLHRPATPDRVEFDLNSGLRRVVRKGPGAEGGKEGLDNLLHCILANRHKFSVGGDLGCLHTDLVCYRCVTWR